MKKNKKKKTRSKPAAPKNTNLSIGKAVHKSDSLVKNFKTEVEYIRSSGSYLSEAHYRDLIKRFHYLNGLGVTGLDNYLKLIEERSPFAIVKIDEARRLADEERARKQQEEARNNSLSTAVVLTPPPQTMILPFEINQISYVGSSPMIPFGGGGGGAADIYFYVTPGTILRASAAGKVSLRKNPISRTPEGQLFDPQDWEMQINLDGGYYLEYDHVINPMVADGDLAAMGQPLAQAAPASIRHGGPQGQLSVDEFEWGLGYSAPERPIRVCPANYLTDEERAKLMNIANPCLAQEAPG